MKKRTGREYAEELVERLEKFRVRADELSKTANSEWYKNHNWSKQDALEMVIMLIESDIAEGKV